MCTTVPTLSVMCGLPFAGKSTIATALAEALGAEVVRLDAINHERGLGLDGRAISPEDWAISYAEADRRLERALAGGRSVIADATHFSRAERDRARALAQAQGARTRVVHVPLTAEEARRRLLANRQTHVRYDVRDDDFALVVTHFEPPDGEPDVVRCSPDASPSEWIAAVRGDRR